MQTRHVSHSQQADADLIAATRRNSFAAFGVLYARYYPRAYEFSCELLGDTQGADELTSDAFGRVLTRLLRGGGPSRGFYSYLVVTIRTTAAERSAAVRGTVPGESPATPARTAPEPRTRPPRTRTQTSPE